MATVVAVVLNYKNHADTSRCVTTLQSQDYPSLKILIVDNKSPNDSFFVLKKAFEGDENIAVIQAVNNGGYATGNNYAVNWAIGWVQPRYILIANPDVELRETETISKLVSFAEITPDAGVVAPRVILPGGFIQGPYDRPRLAMLALQYLFPLVWAVTRWRAQRMSRMLREPKRVFRTVGACMLLVADDFSRVGMFDEATFLEGEEDILAERLQSVSKYFYYVPTTTVIHHHSRRQYKNTRAANRYYFGKYRNKSRFAISVLMFSSLYYEYIIYPFVRMIRSLRRQRSKKQ